MRKIVLGGIVLLLLIGLVVVWYGYKKTFSPNVSCNDEGCEIFIPTGSSFEDVLVILDSSDAIGDMVAFQRLAELKKYPARILPGRYILQNGMDNNQLINLLRSGNQTPVQVTFNNIDHFEELAGVISSQIEADSASLIQLFRSDSAADHFGFSTETFSAMFIANTYEFYWTTDAREFLDRMAVEFNRFWTPSRRASAKQLNFEQSEVVTLASIVEKETVQPDEMPMVAGLYLNRIRKKWPLEADPTVIFAIEEAYPDTQITRVLKSDLKYPSPYNTYLNNGLPPGPIGFPSIRAIDAVLNASEHDYMFMCASVEKPGYHKFAVTYNQHLKNSRAYHQWLDAKRVMR